MTTLLQKIKNIITDNGFISVHDYMALAMSDEEHGYYRKNNPIGEEGDFITAPEISQLFGEMIGLWLATQWQEIGSPENIFLVELGAGRGTLMNDILRATKNIPNFHSSLSIEIIEINETLIEQQKQALSGFNGAINWRGCFADIKQKSILLIANEFFDALPVQQFRKNNDQWQEKVVKINAIGEITFDYITTDECVKVAEKHQNTNDGAVYEHSPQSIYVVKQIAKHIKTYGGAGLIIDYGYYQSEYKNTLQAVKNHKYHDVLKDVGEADITYHVDFSALMRAANSTGATSYINLTQGEFLNAIGINIRSEMLKKTATNSESVDKDIARLTGNDMMGELFKCMAITSHTSKPYPFGSAI